MSQVVAIDGPAASGKSTVARAVARVLDWLYVDSGALYRAITWLALERGVAPSDADAVKALAASVNMQFSASGDVVSFTIDGHVLCPELREERINRSVSEVAKLPEVRARVVAWLQSMPKLGNLVMEGRDIGTKVFPDTPFKFYLDASSEARARRRHADMKAGKEPLSVSSVGDSLKQRDTIDSTRKTDPLRVSADATVIDSTDMSVEDVVGVIVERMGVT